MTVCTHSQGKILAPKDRKSYTTTQLLLLRSLEQKQGTKYTPCTRQHSKGWTKASARILDTSLPSPHIRNKFAFPS